MSFADDERSVSTIIGALFAFTIAIFLVIGYQVAIVPAQNEQVEFNHYQTVQQDLQELRTAQLNAGSTGESRSTTVQLGTAYPSRTFSLNAGPPTGTLETIDVGDSGDGDPEGEITSPSGDIEFDKACGSDPTEVTTRHIVYRPGYNYFSEDSPQRIENTVYYQEAGGVVPPLSRTGQTFIQPGTKTVELFPLQDDFSESATSATTVDMVGAPTGEVQQSGPFTLTVPSQLTESQWDALVSTDLTTGSGDIEITSVSGNRVTFEFTGGPWTLQCHPVGVGDAPEMPNPGTVESPGGGGGGGGSSEGSAFSIGWQDPSSASGTSNCDSENCDWDVSADTDKLLPLIGSTDPSINGIDVSFAVDDTSIGTIGSQDSKTDSNGQASMELQPESNGEVSVYVASGGTSDVINITISNYEPGPPGNKAYDDANNNGVYDSSETTYQKSNIEDGFEDTSVNLVVPSDVGTLAVTSEIKAQNIQLDTGIDTTGSKVKLTAQTDIDLTGQSITTDKEITLNAGQNNGGELIVTDGSLTANNKQVKLTSNGDMYIDGASVDAGSEEATANLNKGSATLFVEGATIVDNDNTLTYEPNGATVSGSPASGSVSKN